MHLRGGFVFAACLLGNLVSAAPTTLGIAELYTGDGGPQVTQELAVLIDVGEGSLDRNLIHLGIIAAIRDLVNMPRSDPVSTGAVTRPIIFHHALINSAVVVYQPEQHLPTPRLLLAEALYLLDLTVRAGAIQGPFTFRVQLSGRTIGAGNVLAYRENLRTGGAELGTAPSATNTTRARHGADLTVGSTTFYSTAGDRTENPNNALHLKLMDKLTFEYTTDASLPFLPSDGAFPAIAGMMLWAGKQQMKTLVGPYSIEFPDYKTRIEATMYNLETFGVQGSEIVAALWTMTLHFARSPAKTRSAEVRVWREALGGQMTANAATISLGRFAPPETQSPSDARSAGNSTS